MVDPWELLDRAMNIETLIVEVSGVAYLIYRNRNGLKRVATKLKIVDSPPDVVVQMKPATARVHAINLSAQSKAVASLMAVPTVSRAAPSALEELLAWYLRIASS